MSRTYKDLTYSAVRRKTGGDMVAYLRTHHKGRVTHIARIRQYTTHDKRDCPSCEDNRLHAIRRDMTAADQRLKGW